MSRIIQTIVYSLLIAAWGACVLGDTPASDVKKQIDRCIKQMGDDDYDVRQQAQETLAKFGFEAFDAISAATNHDDLEIATRARYLLGLMRVQWSVDTDPNSVKECLKDYEFLDTKGRITRMKQLARFADGVGVPALCRLVRFERSPVLSKMAAIQILAIKPDKLPSHDVLSKTLKKETLKKELANSQRPGAQWVLTSLAFDADPDSVLAKWNKYVSSEMIEWQRVRDSVQHTVVVALVRYQMLQLVKLKRTHDATAAIRRLSKLESASSPVVSKLSRWLVEEKAWDVLVEIATQFAQQFRTDPILQYCLAQAHAGQGNKELAEKAAERALELLPGKTEGEIKSHYRLGIYLRSKKLHKWSDKEFRHIVKITPPDHQFNLACRLLLCTSMQKRGMFKEAEKEYRELIKVDSPHKHYRLRACRLLSEMLHDMGNDLAAGETLRDMLNKNKGQRSVGLSHDSIRARIEFFFALHWGEKGDRVKQRQHLKKALDHDASDVDVLIAYYRLPDLSEKERKEIIELIRASADEVRQQIAQSPERPVAYNQYAWLIANTEGDYKEALRFSKKSVELSPESGGYYDTLGRCYFALGDFENAVKTQTKAAKLEPHSGLIAKQLKLFRKTLEKKNKKQAIPPTQ